jgi:hypothetical protein
MIEIGVDGRSQLGLVAFIVEFKQFSFILALPMACSVRVVAIHPFRIDHLDLVVQQPHSLDFVLKHKSLLCLLLMLFLSQPPHKFLDGTAIIV